MSTVKELLEFRRAVRNFDTTKSLDPEKVKACLEAASLAPTSSNLQLWEVVHVTDKSTIRQLGPACFDQTTITSADELVVFLIRPDLVKAHAKAVLDFERDNIARHYPAEKQAKYKSAHAVLYAPRPFPLRPLFGFIRPLPQGFFLRCGSVSPRSPFDG